MLRRVSCSFFFQIPQIRRLHDFNDNYKRTDYIDMLLQNNSTDIVIYDRLKPLVKKNINDNKSTLELLIFSTEEYEKIKMDEDLKLYVGQNNKRDLVAISIKNPSRKSLPETINDNLEIQSFWLQNPMDYLKLENRKVWMKIRGLFAWHFSNLYCGVCGSKTQSLESGHKRSCTNDLCYNVTKPGHDVWTNYPRIDPTVMILPCTKADPLEHRPACLLARKEKFPSGFMSCLTGFINPGESAEAAVERELFEEVGLRCEVLRYHSSDYWPFPSTLLFGFSVDVPGSTDFVLDTKELSLGKWFNIGEVESLLSNSHQTFFVPPRQSVSHRLINDWFQRNRDL